MQPPAPRPRATRPLRVLPSAVPARPVAERVQDFAPVAIDFDTQSAIAEADRCLGCPKQPCVEACPLHTDIPRALSALAEGNVEQAGAIFHATNALPDICGYVCPHERLCEGACVLGRHGCPLAIGALERYATQHSPARPIAPRRRSRKHVLIAGTGPAGLAAASGLLAAGHQVTLIDAAPQPGGWLSSAIPTFKLPREALNRHLDRLLRAGLRLRTGTRLGVDLSLDEARRQADAVLICTGARVEADSPPGADLAGVWQGARLLSAVFGADPGAMPQLGARVIVLGGGGTAIDCARTAARLQAQSGRPVDVTLVYRRRSHEMPAPQRDRQAAEAEGVRFRFQAAPLALRPGANGVLRSIEFAETSAGAVDESGRARPVPVPGSTFLLEADSAIIAFGWQPDPAVRQLDPALELDAAGYIRVDAGTGVTSLPGVYAAGDAVHGPSLVSQAVRDGMRAAAAISTFLSAQN